MRRRAFIQSLLGNLAVIAASRRARAQAWLPADADSVTMAQLAEVVCRLHRARPLRKIWPRNLNMIATIQQEQMPDMDTVLRSTCAGAEPFGALR